MNPRERRSEEQKGLLTNACPCNKKKKKVGCWQLFSCITMLNQGWILCPRELCRHKRSWGRTQIGAVQSLAAVCPGTAGEFDKTAPKAHLHSINLEPALPFPGFVNCLVAEVHYALVGTWRRIPCLVESWYQWKSQGEYLSFYVTFETKARFLAGRVDMSPQYRN